MPVGVIIPATNTARSIIEVVVLLALLKLYLRVSEMRKPVRRPPWSKWHFAGHRVIPQCRVPGHGASPKNIYG